MAAKGNKVRFIQFNGYLNEWNQALQRGDWNNAVVFGYIYDEDNNKVFKKIYAGKDTADLEYIYDLESGGKWSYGEQTEGWHDATAYITNGIGSITTDLTLGDLMAMTNDGEISRIIEMMLFKNPGPQIITLSAVPTSSSPKNSIDVVFKATGADTCHIKITDADSKVLKDEDVNSNISFTLGNLTHSMTYNILATAKKDSEIAQQSIQVTTNAAVLPVVNIDDISTSNNTTDNKFKISDISIARTANDYTLGTNFSYKITGGDIAKDYLTLAELKAENLGFNTNYVIQERYNASCNYHYPDVTPVVQNFTSNTYTLNKPISGTGSVSITKINDIVITESTPMPIEVQNPSVNIEYTVNPRLVLANTSLYKNSVGIDTQIGLSAGTYVYETSLDVSTNPYQMIVKASDEYNTDYAVSNQVSVLYNKPLKYLISSISKDSSHYYDWYGTSGGYVKATLILNKGRQDGYITTQLAGDLVTVTQSETFYVGSAANAGKLVNYIDEAKNANYFNLKESTLVNTTKVSGRTFYGYEIPGNVLNSGLVMMIPATINNVLLYDDFQSTPFNPMSIGKSAKTITIDEEEYYIWYPEGAWQQYNIGQVYWISVD